MSSKCQVLLLVLMVLLSSAEVIIKTNRNDTYHFIDFQAAIGGYLRAEGITYPVKIGMPYDACSKMTFLKEDKIVVTKRDTQREEEEVKEQNKRTIKNTNDMNDDDEDQNRYLDSRDEIVLVTRGNCDFTTKIRNAQNAGYRGVIVSDNVDGPLIVMNSHRIVLDLYIPAVFVTKKDGNLMFDIINGGILHQLDHNITLCNATLLRTQYPVSWPTFVLPFIVVIVVALFLLSFYFIYRRRSSRVAQQRTLSKADVQSLPTRKFDKKSNSTYNEMCVICLEDFLPNDNIRILPCHHDFHCGCIDKWLVCRNRLCPICKRDAFILPTETTPLLASSTSLAVVDVEQCLVETVTNDAESSCPGGIPTADVDADVDVEEGIRSAPRDKKSNATTATTTTTTTTTMATSDIDLSD